jgi:hypothetical protein
MEPLDTMKRKAAFKPPKVQQSTVSDSRFGLRRLLLNPQERPRIAVYKTPGKGVKGEHLN